MTGTLLPFAAGIVLAVAALAFVLYLWTWIRYVALPEGPARAGERRYEQPCAGCPALA